MRNNNSHEDARFLKQNTIFLLLDVGEVGSRSGTTRTLTTCSTRYLQ
jgi:hypothetical protein